MTNHSKVFQLWIEYLKEAPYETWSKEVQEDFEGCHDHPTDSIEFQGWLLKANWERKLFFDEDQIVPTVVHPGVMGRPPLERQITLEVDIEAPDEAITAGVLAYVNLYREERELERRKKGRPVFEPDPAKYPLTARPDTEALEIALTVHRLLKEHLPKKSGESGVNLKVAKALVKRFPIARELQKKSAGTDRDKELSDLITRYKARALRVIEGVKVGKFPEM
jgi:hypothetical protein